MSVMLESFAGFVLEVEVGPGTKEYWRCIANLGPVDADFTSRMEKRAKPRRWDDAGNREDAATYAAISAWTERDMAILEGQQANEAWVDNGRDGFRFRYVVRFEANGNRGHAWANDETGPDEHVSVWGEPRHFARSTLGDPVPIPGTEA